MGMRKVFSVSMPRAGHHVAEMVLGRSLGSKFHYCEYYTPKDCCRTIPCARMRAAEAAGAVLFMQKSHDHALSDPITAAYDGYAIQVREPIARVLSNYELELKTSGIKHSRSYQQFWLGLEAHYVVGFIQKWCNRDDIRSVLLKYEDLLSDPVGYFGKLFDALDIPRDYFIPEAVLESQRVSSGNKRPFRRRAIESSTYYDIGNLSTFGKVIAPAAITIGYPLSIPAGGDESARQIELVYRTKVCLDRGDFQEAIELINECLRDPLAHPFLLRIRGGIYLSLGLTRDAERDFLATMQREPDHPDAYLQYANLLRVQGAPASSIDKVLRACLDNAGNKSVSAQLIRGQFPDSESATIAQTHVMQSITREEVITAFKVLLGRDPEDERVIASHQNVNSLEALRKILLESREFAQKFEDLVHPAGSVERATANGGQW